MQKKMRYLPILLLAVLLAGCAGAQSSRTERQRQEEQKKEAAQRQAEAEQEQKRLETSLYILTSLDQEGKKITLRDCNSQREETFSYTGGTYVKDKYGGSLAINQLQPGEGVKITMAGQALGSIQVSDEVFSYDDVHNFSIDPEEKTLTVGKSSYYFDDSLLIFYRGSRISLAEISRQDTLCLKGAGKRLYAVQVTNGHGTVVLENPELFLGGYVVIGNVLSREIGEENRMEVPEGTHLLSVANDGYGGSREITVEANRETAVNLEELRGEGPRYGSVQFQITPGNAAVTLAGSPVDTSVPQELAFGSYRLLIQAEGYADWSGILVVDSEQAVISLKLVTAEEAAAQEKADKEEEEKKKEEEKEDETQKKLDEVLEELKKNVISTSGGQSALSSIFEKLT